MKTRNDGHVMDRLIVNKKGLAAATPKSLIFLVGVEGLEPSTN
jgi:hypothetical protein